MKPFKSFFSPLSLGEGSGVRPLSLFLFASLFLASCGEQTELQQPGVTNGETVEVTQEIRVNVLPMQTVGSPATRSGETKPEKGEAIGITYGSDVTTRVQEGTSDMNSNESKINNAYIVQFSGTDPTSTAKYVSADIKGQLSNGSAIPCGFTMTAGVKNRVYVVANVATIPTVGMTLAQFEAPTNYTPGTALPGTGLPMSAMQDIGVGDVFDVFQLKSVLAKLTFKCSTGSLKLKGVSSGYTFYTQMQPGNNVVRHSQMTYSAQVTLTSGATYYVPENLSGRVQLPSPLLRCSLFAPANSLFVEISANSTTYNIYLGDSSVSDFNFTGGYAYNINATLYGTSDLDLRVGTSVITDLNSAGTANCYLSTEAGKWYSFNATVMGNDATTPAHTKTAISGDLDFPAITPSALNPVSADVLWESVNTATAPAKGTIVNHVFYAKDRIWFASGSTLGNAVIAAKDASNNIVWSWHIWRTEGIIDAITFPTITDGAGFTAPTLKLMDRNLGALRATPNSGVTAEQDYGLYYQWGRKDPFQTQGSVTTAFGGNAITPADAVKNPTTFYIGIDWTLRNDNLWGCPLTELTAAINTIQFNKNAGSKSIYDPCPVGWKVMPAYAFANATMANSSWDLANRGRDFKAVTTATSTPFFFPASGIRGLSNGRLDDVGTDGYYWASSPDATTTSRGSELNFDDRYVYPSNSNFRTSGNGVRCVQEYVPDLYSVGDFPPVQRLK